MRKGERLTHVSISLGDLTARNGASQMIFRCDLDDKHDLDKAAEKLNMSTAQFIRMIAIQAARKVLAEVE
jgi:uncharacterized protein (DUF1778 family)